MEHQRDDSIMMRFVQLHHACYKPACEFALASIPPICWTISSRFSFSIFAHLYSFLHLGPTYSTCKFFTRPNNKQQQCNTAIPHNSKDPLVLVPLNPLNNTSVKPTLRTSTQFPHSLASTFTHTTRSSTRHSST